MNDSVENFFFSFDELIRNPVTNRSGQRFHENRKFDELIELDVRQARKKRCTYVAAIDLYMCRLLHPLASLRGQCAVDASS